MKKLAFGLSCLCIVLLCGCEKNSCQTFIQGPWTTVKYPQDSARVARDSVYFYGGDSLTEVYKYRYPADTNIQVQNTTYFITDNCDEVDFNGSNTWTQLSTTPKFSILLITPYNFEIRSKAAANNCDSCVISFYR